ncbi:hypothetical protein GIB67_009395 [Kingdonia uniflora]|uniref:OTU domain-containing protein n=1 Tax=Kingdonia uniflora TaxID=39325 RepID=A0A7J7N326_9MAGN|nr:hypothetical protein GIB67_009395 [Kingdonia uniflora]
MGKLFCDSSLTAIAETFQPSSSPAATLPWFDPQIKTADLDNNETKTTWETVSGLEDQQKRYLERLQTKGVQWKNSVSGYSTIFLLSHGGDVEADGNCLFTALEKAMGAESIDARELRGRTVKRFLEDLGSDDLERESIDEAIKHLYSPDLRTGWGIHVVQEVKLLASKRDREGLDVAITELVDLGLQRELAAETIYRERCIAVEDGPSWAKYMAISGSPDDEFDIITLQYTEEGLLSVDDNVEGHAAAFGDDIAIVCLATEFHREIFVVQAHGSDAMVDEDNCVFFLPHRPRSQIHEPPLFLFMKGTGNWKFTTVFLSILLRTGWCGAGADHYEPLITHSAPLLSIEKAAVVL